MNDVTLKSFAGEKLSYVGWMLRESAGWLISAPPSQRPVGQHHTDRTELGTK